MRLAARPRAAESIVPLQNLQFLRGDCLARLGRFREAEAAFLEEIRVFPGNAAPRAAMALARAPPIPQSIPLTANARSRSRIKPMPIERAATSSSRVACSR